MGQDIAIQTPEALTPFSQGVANSAAATQGLRSVSALQGVDLGDEGSVDNALSGLVKAGALDQAKAVADLAVTRAAVPTALRTISKFDTAVNGQPPAQPGSGVPAATDPTQAAQPGAAPPVDYQHAYDSMTLGSKAAQELMDTPLPARPARAAEIRADFIKRGVPAQAIDQWLGDIGNGEPGHVDATGATVPGTGLAGAKEHFDQMAAHFAAVEPSIKTQGAGGGSVDPATGEVTAVAPRSPGSVAQPDAGAAAAPAAPPQAPGLHQNTYDWTKNVLSDPSVAAGVGLLKKFGLDYSPVLSTALAVQSPNITNQSNLDYTAPLTEARLPYTRETLPTPSGAQLEVTGRQAQDILTNGGVGTVRGPSNVEAETQHQEAAAPYSLVTAPINGTPQTMTLDQYRKAAAAGMPGLGVGLSPQETASKTADAQNLQEFVGRAAQSNLQLQTQSANAQKLTALAGAVSTGKYGPAIEELARTFPLGHSAQDYAAHAELLQQDLGASFQGALGGMAIPRLTSEAGAITSAIPHGVGSQGDAITLYGTGLQAATNYAKRYNDFVVNFAQQNPHNPSLAAAQAAWNNGPGRASILADPAFANLKLSNGKPAVVIDPKTGAGVFMPGTKAAFSFWAR